MRHTVVLISGEETPKHYYYDPRVMGRSQAEKAAKREFNCDAPDSILHFNSEMPNPAET